MVCLFSTTFKRPGVKYFPKWQLPKDQDWLRGRALQLEQDRGSSAAARIYLGYCRFRNCKVGKLPLGKIPLGSCRWKKKNFGNLPLRKNFGKVPNIFENVRDHENFVNVKFFLNNQDIILSRMERFIWCTLPSRFTIYGRTV